MKNAVEKQRSGAGRIILIVFAVVLAGLLAAGELLMADYYRTRFPRNTYVNEMDVSYMTVDSVKELMQEVAKNYSLTISERGGAVETIMAEQIATTYKDDGAIDQLHSRYNPYLWFIYYFQTDSLMAESDFTYDTAAAEKVIGALTCFNPAYAKAPTNAELTLTADSCAIQPEEQGNQLDEEKTKAAITAALDGCVTQLDFEEQDLYQKPTVFSDDETLNAQLQQVQKLLKADITFDFDDRTEEVTASDIVDFLVQNKDGSYGLDQEKVAEYVKTNLAHKYDTFGLSHNFTTHDGSKIKLDYGGDYGWCIAKGSTTEKLMKAIEAGETTTMEPEYLYTAKSRTVDDIGGTYVEISIDAQTLWCYQDYDLVVETPIVTGNPNKGNGTPSGHVWAINVKKSPATLGTIETMGYSSPVNFWMPFTGNVGMHDADGWRTAYGGEIYKSSGSHGCVNMPYDAAATVYDIVEVGTAVVVY